MKILEHVIRIINDNALTIMAIGAVTVLLFWGTNGPRAIMALWLLLTACRVAEEVHEDRKQRDMFFGQLNPDGSWKIPTQERIRR